MVNLKKIPVNDYKEFGATSRSHAIRLLKKKGITGKGQTQESIFIQLASITKVSPPVDGATINAKIQEVADMKLTKKTDTIYKSKRVTINLGPRIGVSDIIARIPLKPNGEFYIIEVGGVGYIINEKNKAKIIKAVKSGMLDQGEEYTESDGRVISVVKQNIDKVKVSRMISLRKKTDGKFFKYTHNLDLDLSRYGLFKEVDPKNYEINCLYRALQSADIDPHKLDKIKLMMTDRGVPKCKLNKVAELIGKTIKLKELKSTHKEDIKYGTSEEVIEIGLIDEHYFLVEEVPITSYALKNYDTLRDIPDFHKIIKKNLEKSNKRYITSYTLIKYLFETKEHLEPIDFNNAIMNTPYYDKATEIRTLKYEETDTVEIKKPEQKESKNLPLIFFDFEADVTGSKHEPYIICSIDDKGEKKAFRGKFCGLNFLKSIEEDSHLVAHNLGYDIRFLFQHLFNIQKIEKGNTIMKASGSFKNHENNRTVKLTFQDSYMVIPEPLRKFPKMFNLGNLIKEIMPYELYNPTTLNKSEVKISEALNYIRKSERTQFKENVKALNLEGRNPKYFKHLDYAEYYCIRDCEVLKSGYNTFKKWMKEVTKLDITEEVSLPSMVDKYLINEGCYDGVYELAGIPREFIMKTVVGGRCMTRENKMWHTKQRLADFDGVSLYPSAMVRLKGFLKGKPKIIEDLSYNAIKNYDGYFCEVNISNINKSRPFPLINRVTEEDTENAMAGTRNFCNDLRGRFFVNKTTLEDYIEFHEIDTKDIQIIRGYYYDEGFNTKERVIMQKLFNERLKKKKEGNPIQVVYKLLMNSAYGKTIMKPIITEKMIIDSEEKALKYIGRNFNYIRSYTKFGNKYSITVVKPIVDHYSRPHVGSEILAMSKRIMNEVMNLADDLNINIYYQDTDSMHIEADKVQELGEEFKKKYGRDLIGKKLGQFHCDFDFKTKEGHEPVAVESYFLAKKIYFDKVEVYDEEDNIKYEEHIRMKGVPSNCIINYSSKVIDTYKRLYNGEAITFNLLSESEDGDKRCYFKYNSDYTIESRRDYVKTVRTRLPKGN